MLPILQMIIEPNDNGYFGLKFSTETEHYLPPVFVIPIPKNGLQFPDEYYMPGEIRGDVVNFIARFNRDFNLLQIDDKRLGGNTVRFQLSYENPYFSDAPMVDKFAFNERPPLIPWIYENFRYIGKETDLVRNYSGFILLNPIDLIIMDELYHQMAACFVGLTPVYGDREFNGNQR